MRLSLALFAVLALSSCHVIVHDVPVRHEHVQVVHHHHVAPRCHVHEEYQGRRPSGISCWSPCPGPRPIGFTPPRASKGKRY